MAKNLFQNLDLNLLHVFFILYRERNMRLTAGRLFVSQPAISKSLQKLRHHFGDELFVKIPSGLEPTPFAVNLFQSISPVYQDLELAVNSVNEFDPAALEDTFHIALSPFLLNSIGSKLFLNIMASAPKCNVQMYKWSTDSLSQIQQDRLHLGLTYQIPELPSEVSEKYISTERFKCYVRKNHPCKKTSISLSEAAQYDFAAIIAADWNYQQTIAQGIFAKNNLDYRVKFRSELPSTILDVISETDMIAPLSGFLDISHYPQLRAIKINVDEGVLDYKISTYFHYKNRQNPLTQWLNNLVLKTFEEQKQKQKSPLI
ncbi:LysR family transcriptional regulator [Shewanella electrodiphila]|uniref:LysR family transcriptional regulator n=1 Tax=Shewanella electrodiphila TaxID=934143 RepID=A0ABT0KVH2_9GAMM|nr:LysR family transcriptional regulator [Shewanella electrodiphila]MCL1047390.1 LysR family transcriptional regulator [Shewanella electrodiphila]